MKNKEAKSLFELLKSEHKEVKSLLERAEEAKDGQRGELLEQIESNLIPHARAEEKTLYATMRERALAKEDEECITLTNEAYEEHKLVDELLAELEKISVRDETWPAKLKVIKENLEHHIQEEEDEIFSQARELFSQKELTELLDAYLISKEKFQASLPSQAQIKEKSPSAESKKLAS